MQTDTEELRTAVIKGIRHARLAFSKHHPGESLNGFALVTDDGLETLGYFANSEEFTAQNGEGNVRFEPVEWLYCEGDSGFAQARSILTSMARTAGANGVFAEHVRAAFGVLVDSLIAARAEGLFRQEVFLTVISTDPSDELVRLENQAVPQLNSPELVEAWQVARAAG